LPSSSEALIPNVITCISARFLKKISWDFVPKAGNGRGRKGQERKERTEGKKEKGK